MKPMTTEGIPDSSSIRGFTVSLILDEAISARYAAQAIPIGIAIAVDTRVIIIVDTKKGSMPKVGGSETGYHLVPEKNSHGGVWRKIGVPSRTKKKTIPKRITMASIPARRIQPSINLSLRRHHRKPFPLPAVAMATAMLRGSIFTALPCLFGGVLQFNYL